MWPFKKRPSSVADDLHEAKRLREISTAQLAAVERRDDAVTQLGDYLSTRRQQNHFGESIQITFTRRGHA